MDMIATRLLAVVGACAATTLQAQTHDTHDMAGMRHTTPAAVSPLARRQIDSVAKAVQSLGTTDAAEKAGMHSAFGWIPTMGVHWVSRQQMMNGRQTDKTKPSQLMFSKISGKDSLVGIAYAYITADNDTVRPVLFDGAPAWHEHEDLAPDGLTLVMLHVWFVPSPDGPFAGTNPNLPFWALGLAAPNAARMAKDTAFKARMYRASLALAEVADTNAILPQLERRQEVRASLAARRDTVRALVPELLAAQRAKDSVKWNRAADKAAKQWHAMQATYVGSAHSPEGRARIERFINMLLGEHVHGAVR
jgi:hypothetical protein